MFANPDFIYRIGTIDMSNHILFSQNLKVYTANSGTLVIFRRSWTINYISLLKAVKTSMGVSWYFYLGNSETKTFKNVANNNMTWCERKTCLIVMMTPFAKAEGLKSPLLPPPFQNCIQTNTFLNLVYKIIALWCYIILDIPFMFVVRSLY